MDVNNVQMFANINMEEPNEDVFTPEMGQANNQPSPQQPDFQPADPYKQFQVASDKMKFKKKSQMDEGNLNSILENKARISINTKTGKHEFTYGHVDKTAENYLQNSDSLVKFQDTSLND